MSNSQFDNSLPCPTSVGIAVAEGDRAGATFGHSAALLLQVVTHYLLHSSCACACASCACACACACAGGGRAGCTYKDFYRTDLKLRQLAKKHKK